MAVFVIIFMCIVYLLVDQIPGGRAINQRPTSPKPTGDPPPQKSARNKGE